MRECKEMRDLISMYVDNELSQVQKIEVERHISSCNKCNEEYVSLIELTNSLRLIEDIDLPGDFSHNLNKKLQGERDFIIKEQKQLKSKKILKFSYAFAAVFMVVIFSKWAIDYYGEGYGYEKKVKIESITNPIITPSENTSDTINGGVKKETLVDNSNTIKPMNQESSGKIKDNNGFEDANTDNRLYEKSSSSKGLEWSKVEKDLKTPVTKPLKPMLKLSPTMDNQVVVTNAPSSNPNTSLSNPNPPVINTNVPGSNNFVLDKEGIITKDETTDIAVGESSNKDEKVPTLDMPSVAMTKSDKIVKNITVFSENKKAVLANVQKILEDVKVEYIMVESDVSIGILPSSDIICHIKYEKYQEILIKLNEESYNIKFDEAIKDTEFDVNILVK